MPDGASRNRAITTAYFQLSTELCRRSGAAANWCTFATWASRQAGLTIRHEDLLDTLRHRLRVSPALISAFRDLVAVIGDRRLDLVELVTAKIGEIGPLKRAGEAVARGNKKVFEEIGLEFARFLARFGSLAAIEEAEFEDFVASLRDGEPPDGQRLLRQAFRAYRSAALAATPQARAEWLLFANLSIGYHEQIRLQPEIRAALDAAAFDSETLAAALLDQLGRPEDGLRSALRRLLPSAARRVRQLAGLIAEEVRRLVRQIVTEHLMTLRLDQVVIRLGHDVQQPCPPELQQLQAPELLGLLASIDPHPDGPLGSGAEDWGDFPQRMHFIAELFRAWQHDERLLAEP
jgi:hypothetical protein